MASSLTATHIQRRFCPDAQTTFAPILILLLINFICVKVNKRSGESRRREEA
jgi:hypothetical protein